MNFKYIKRVLFLSGFLIILLCSSAFAAEVAFPEEITDAYQKWQLLSNKEKSKTIEPLPFSLKIGDSVKKSVLNSFTVNVGQSIDSQYNLHDDVEYRIKNQGSTNECWAFSTTILLENNAMKKRNLNIELSPRHIDYATSRTFLDGINTKGYNREVGYGNFYVSMGYCTSGKGPVLESDMPFENNSNKVNLSAIDKQPVLKVKDYTNFASVKKIHENGTITYTDGGTTTYTEEQVEGIRNLIKKHIKENGGVSAFMYTGDDLNEYIRATDGIACYYNDNPNNMYNHAITLVGWNDDFTTERFNSNHKPTKKGAYLALNTSTGGNDLLSLIAISYEDVWIEYGNVGISETSDIDYDKIYQYDDYGYDIALTLLDDQTHQAASSGYIANVFNRQELQDKDEYLKEVSIYVTNTSNVDIYLNTNSDDKSSLTKAASAGILDPGYHTVELATPIKLTGDSFVVAAKLTTDRVTFGTETNTSTNGLQSLDWDYATSEAGQSFISTNGTDWEDLITKVNDSNICLKAFTNFQDKVGGQIEPTPTPTQTPTPTTEQQVPTPTPTPVVDNSVSVTSIELEKDNIELKEGEAYTLVATINPSNATNKNIRWSSSNEKVATVSKQGIITAVGQGKATIYATTEDQNKTATCSVEVKGTIPVEDLVYYGTNQTTTITDSTVASGRIPQTGELILITIGVVILLGTVITIIVIKIRKLKDVK